MSRAAQSRVDVVIPAFNEERNIAVLVDRARGVLDALGLDWRIVFVDDGSRDATREAIRQQHRLDPRIEAVFLSRNFGKEIAIAAGLRKATGDAVIVMDADLQHPPETIRDFVVAWRDGADVVLGHRADEKHAGFFRRLASTAFYPVFRLLSQIPLEAGAVDFVLLDRIAVDALNRFDERRRFTKGLFRWIGFETRTIDFVCAERTEGSSSFHFGRLASFALDGIIAFSSFPLRVWSGIGAIISTGAILYALYFIFRTLIFGSAVPGFPSLIVSITFLSGIQLLSLGVIGEYLSRVYEEVKGRPIYLVREELGGTGVADDRPAPPSAPAPVSPPATPPGTRAG